MPLWMTLVLPFFVAIMEKTSSTASERRDSVVTYIPLSKFQVDVELHCTALQMEMEYSATQRFFFKHWVLPDLGVIDANATLQPTGNIVLTPGNYSLRISRIDENQDGDYLCYVEDSNGFPLYSKTSIFLHIPPVWETYRLNFIMAIAASGAFLLLATIFCVVTTLRWKKVWPMITGTDEPTGQNKAEGSTPGLPNDHDLVSDPALTSGVTVFKIAVSEEEKVEGPRDLRKTVDVEDTTVM